ncbi:unnamed protein product [Xyrichtys novacula]|uniref:Unnamed protein product n=1 Tax=Xyrichtys novacula TaxID=13765 RepID=A0AAV1GPG9_XYRNO|nr:unnamed protein product [Xyrichtys novacula]
MENYQGSTISRVPLISRSPGTNYCGIIVSPQRPDELQAPWAQRVSDQQAKAWSTGSQSQKPTVPLVEMLHEGSQTDSSTVKRLFPACRLSTVALSPARHPSLRRPLQRWESV